MPVLLAWVLIGALSTLVLLGPAAVNGSEAASGEKPPRCRESTAAGRTRAADLWNGESRRHHRGCSPYSPLAIMSALRIFCLAYSSNEMPDILAASTSCGVSVTLPGVMRLPVEFGTSRLTGALKLLDGFAADRAAVVV